MTTSPKPRLVLFDHDGGIDDLLSLTMLLAMPHLELSGIIVTPADCFLRPAVSASLKVLRFFDRLDIDLCEGTLYGVNPFPRAWRAHAYAVDALPILNELKPVQPLEDTPPPVVLPGSRLESPLTGNPLQDMEQRLRAKLMTELDLSPGGVTTDVGEHSLQALYDRSLRHENIVLSRTEKNQLFRRLVHQILSRRAGVLPVPSAEPGHEFIARKLREATQPVTVLITGPVTNLATALATEPELAAMVEEVVWMGGALQVPGNVSDYEHDGSAEWNAYWDPPATHSLWQSGVPLTLFSLDATNNVPVTLDFLHRLAQQRRHPLSDLAGQCWALTVGTLPAYEYTYHMWDTLTTGYLGGAQFMTFREARTEAIPYGPSAGRIKEVTEGGKLIKVAEQVDVEGFHNYLLELFRR
ncbi:MAG: nucleoside hydrolase [Anaerolineae bacterium]|nr:nucleoside hydrolase [Anaerolineae bacterium]